MNIHIWAIVIALSPIAAFLAIIPVVFYVEKFLRANKRRSRKPGQTT